MAARGIRTGRKKYKRAPMKSITNSTYRGIRIKFWWDTDQDGKRWVVAQPIAYSGPIAVSSTKKGALEDIKPKIDLALARGNL